MEILAPKGYWSERFVYDVLAIPQGSYALYTLLYAVFILFISVFYSWLFQIMLGKVII